MADGAYDAVQEDVYSAFTTNGTLMGGASYTIAENVANITYFVSKSETSAITSIEAEKNEAVKYYNLQGVEVASDDLETGLYICKQGNKAVKVLVK